ncbi:MAG: phosphopantetheine-binding protein [Desulfuromonadaceae bacterium]|nr:phosphopantetheine-binding protein [Desulfuromonadaceae bacterium]
MTEEEVIELIDSSLAEEFELERSEMTPEANIYEDLGLDSLDTVDMVIVLEGAFSFKIREEESVRAIRTLGDIHRFVLTKVSENG